jgi:PQQ-dependent dehydrogenase (methanol/ethanol family)
VRRWEVRRRNSGLIGLAALVVCACIPDGEQSAGERSGQRSPATIALTPAANAAIEARLAAAPEAEDDGQWTMPARNYASWRFSGLADITADNVAGLAVAWTWPTGRMPGHEAPPLVIGSTLYFVTPFPNEVVALDLGSLPPVVKWQYAPPVLPSAAGVACCDQVNRGMVYADGRLFFNTLDNQTVAIDAETGSEVWRVRLGDINRGETMTMAPLVVKDKVLVGNSGGELGVRGWLTALDSATGTIAWRAYSTGPDSEVLIGAEYEPFYEQERGADLGVHSWPPDAWRIGGGTVWGWLSYDEELDLIYYGTANPGPWSPEVRPGDNKWTSGLFARDPDTGQARWFYQLSPHDTFDYDGVNENVLIDREIAGQRRRVLLHPDRNGYLYEIDRATGEVLSADPYVHITTSTGVDLATGRLKHAPEKMPELGKVIRDICPSAAGGKDWQPSSFSPRTRLLYIPHQNLCTDWEVTGVNYIAGTPYLGVNSTMYAGPGGHRGELTAWDVESRAPAWRLTERFPVWSGTLVTAGDLVFYGTMDRRFKAVDAVSGELKWEHETSSGVIGQPITYRGPDGKQYVAVFAGVGGWAGAIVSQGLSPEDPTAGGGFVGAMQDLPQYTGAGGELYVFALP